MRRFVKKHNKKLTVEEADQICRVTIVFNLMAIFFLFLFALISVSTDDFLHAKILLWIVWFAMANIVLFLVTGRMTPFILITCFSYLVFSAYLQITGGQDNTGVLWHYVYPLMVYYIAGIYMGSICAASLILVEILLMTFDHLFPFQTIYPMAFKIRFLATMIVMSVFGAMLEYSRWSAQRKLITTAEKFHIASQTDELTGLANRRALKEKLEDESARSARTEKDFVILLCDVDNFKKVNDVYGHTVGDAALKHLAVIFRQVLRKYDLAARWGGEEFLFLLPDTDLEEGKSVAERIRLEVAQSSFQVAEGVRGKLTISCGIGHWKQSPDLDELIRITDDRLYRAKQEGRNRVAW